MAAPVFRIGSEQKVSTVTADIHVDPSITRLPDGGWIVTWHSYDVDGSTNGIYLQRYSADGKPIGGEQKLDTLDPDYFAGQPSTTVLSDGGWLVTWVNFHLGSDDIYQQRYDSSGVPLFLDESGKPVERLINTIQTSHQKTPNVTALADGGWVVTWESADQDGSGFNIYQQRYNSSGQPLYKNEQGHTADKLVNTTTADHQRSPKVTALSDGGWIVTWDSLEQDGSSGGIYQQHYDSKGQPLFRDALGNPVDRLVNVITDSNQTDPSVAALADGGWIVTWRSWGQTPSGPNFEIYQQRYDSKGHPLFKDTAGNPVDRLVNVTTHESPGSPNVTALADGGWLIVWTSNDTNTEDLWSGVFMQRYDAQGVAQYSTDQLVAASASGNQLEPSVTTLADGSWVITWVSNDQDGKGVGIYQRVYELNAAPTQILLDSQPVCEAAANDTVVGTLSAADRNVGDTFTYTLTDDAAGRFAIVDGKVVVKDASKLDYEAATSHQIMVKVTDQAGEAYEQTFTITVSDALDILRGGKGKDKLTGTAGEDRLYGGRGNDTLTGKSGADVFVFDTKPHKKKNLDKITDFAVKDDTIWLDNKVFKKLGKKGSEDKPVKLNKKFFTIGDKAKDKNDYLIYNKKKGVLYYDQDGSGSKAAVEIAKLAKKLKMTAADFFVV